MYRPDIEGRPGFIKFDARRREQLNELQAAEEAWALWRKIYPSERRSSVTASPRESINPRGTISFNQPRSAQPALARVK